MYKQGKYPIIKKSAIAKGIFDLTVKCPEIAAEARAGQFAQITCEGFFLRRPISICQIDKDNGTLRFVFEVRGKGTGRLSELNVGSAIDIIAPLGNGFRLIPNAKAVCIGGGIGTPPMVGVADFYGENCTVISGFRSANAVILQDVFVKSGAETILCTNDGTAGIHGFVTTALEDLLKTEKPDIIYACGPTPMLKGISEIAEKNGIEAQVSLEQRMACGVGACLGCVCTVIKDGKEVYSHVCKDGPVFDSKEVVFDG